MSEAENVKKSLALDKSLGSDGLTTNNYRQF